MRTLINSLMIAASFVLVATTNAQTPVTSGPIYVMPAPQAGQMVGCCTTPQPVPQSCCFGQPASAPSFDQQVDEMLKREASLNKLRDAAPSAQIPWLMLLPWLGLFGILVYWISRQFPVRTISLRGVPVTVGPLPAAPRPAPGVYCAACGNGPAPAGAVHCRNCGTRL